MVVWGFGGRVVVILCLFSHPINIEQKDEAKGAGRAGGLEAPEQNGARYKNSWPFISAHTKCLFHRSLMGKKVTSLSRLDWALSPNFLLSGGNLGLSQVVLSGLGKDGPGTGKAFLLSKSFCGHLPRPGLAVSLLR
jgi:hypothetical protein